MTVSYRRAFFLLLLAAAIVLAAGLGLRDPWPADEPRFALIARDMALGGNWLFPNVGGVLYPDKPPLHFWSVAALFHVTGSLRFSFLFPAFLAGMGTLVLVTDLGRRLWGHAAGIWSGAVLLSLLQFPLQMKAGQLDGPLCFWTTLSLYGLCRHLLLGPNWTWYALGGAAAGMGILTKGVGFLPFLIFLPYLLAVQQQWKIPVIAGKDWRWLLAPTLILGVVAAWLLPMLIVTSGASDPALIGYRDNILFHQTVTRYANSWGHIKPPWYLWTNAVPWLWLPATLLLPWLFGAWRRELRDKRNAALLMLIGWVLLVLVFFSISAGKRSVYIFPAAPAFALIVGACMPALAKSAGVRRAVGLFPILAGSALAAVGMYGLMHPHALLEWLPNTLSVVQSTLSVLVIGIACVLFGLLSVWRRPFLGVAVSLSAIWLGTSLFVAPQINTTRSGEALVHAATQALVPEQELGLVGWPEQFLLYLERPVVHFGYRRPRDAEVADAVAWLALDPSRRVLIDKALVEDCLADGGTTAVGRAHRRDWLLLSREGLKPSCHPERSRLPVTTYAYETPIQLGSKKVDPENAGAQLIVHR